MPRLMLGLGDLAVSGERGDTLVTTALGSCVAVLVRSRQQVVCGMVHVVVPGPPPRVGAVPKSGYYADTAVRSLLEACARMGVQVGLGAEVLLVGGASVVEGLQSFDVGRRNVLAVRRALWAQGLMPAMEDVDGTDSRSVSVEVETGVVRVRNPTRGEWTLD